MRRKHAILTKGKRAFAGVMAAMLAATAAPVAYAEELPAAQTVAEETTQQETQDFEENTLDTETVDSADSADTSVDSTETAVDTADNEETTDSEEKAEANDTVTGADDESESSDAAQQAIPAEQNTDEPEVAVYAAQGDFSWGNSESSTANSGDISALSAAISNATGTVYVKLNGDVTVPYGSRLNVPAGKTVYLDLAGHTLYTDYGEESTLIQVSGGELHIKDSSTEKTGTLSAGNAGRVVSVIDNGTLILDSGKITKTDRAGDSCLLFIKQSSVTMNGGILTGGNHITHGAVVMNEGGHFTMNGGEIKDNTSIRDATDSGAAIYMAGTTEFTMNGGSITNNTTTSGAGAAISATNATATIAIHGGTISNNSAKKGGAIYFKGTLLLDETSGTLLIQNNTATQNGGAIATTSGSNVIVMKAGTISGNTAGAQYNGGAIFCAGKFTMTGGQITNNISGYGAVCLQSNTAFNMLGGTISGNTGTGSNKRGAGLYSTNRTGEINIGGTASISGNKLSSPKTNEEESNIYVYSSKLLKILQSGNQVDTGLNETITVNQNWSGKAGVHQGKSAENNLYQVSQNGDISNIENVIPDNSQYQTIYKDGALYIFAHTSHSWKKTASGNQITYTCNEQYCQYHANPLTLTVNAENMEYTGSAYDKASFVDNITPVVTNNTTVSGIIYFMANGTKTSPNGISGASTAGGAPVNAGKYKAVVTINNYYKAEKAFEITKTQNAWITNPTITGWTYGDAPNSPVSAAKCGEVAVTYAKQGTNNFTTEVPTAAGTYTARFTVAEDANYTGLTQDVDFTVAPKPITVTPDAKSKAYGETDPELTYTVNANGLVGEDTLQGIILTRVAGETVGEYTISSTQGENANPNYQITFATAIFTITPKKVEVNAVGYTGTYDGNAHSITVTVTDPANGATITYSTEENGSYTADNPTFTNAGEYTVYYKVTNDGYTEEKSSAKVIIQKKTVTAVIFAANKVYDGNTDAAVSATVDTGIAGETLTISGLFGAFADKNVGNGKTVTVSGNLTVTAGGDAKAGNYDVSYANTTTANITAKQITVTITAGASGTYGGEITPASAKLDGVVGEDAPEITLTYTGTANDGTEYNSTEAPTKAGTYTVTAKTTDPNYTLDATTATAEFTIAKRPATVTPEDKSKVYEEKDPELTYKVEGVLDGEELTDITLTRDKGENAGEYAINGNAEADANPNYDVTFAAGKFTIDPKPIDGATVKLGAGLTANGEEQTQTVAEVLLNDKAIPADSYTVTGNTATAPGSHTLTITGKGNYTGSIKWTYVIAPAKAEDAPGADIVIGSGTVKVAVKSEGNVPTTTLLTDKAELLAMLVDNGDITADELAQIANGASVDVVLTVKEANVTDETKAAMAQAAKDYTIGQYLDISLFKYMTVNGVAQDGVALHTTKDALTISVAVPDALINTNGAYNRSYCIVRYHGDMATVLDATFDATNKTLTFKTDRFSDYAIAYNDTAVPSSDTNTSSNENKQTEATPTPTPAPASTAAPSTMTRVPKTGDTSNPMLYAVLLVVSLFGLAATFVCKRRNNK